MKSKSLFLLMAMLISYAASSTSTAQIISPVCVRCFVEVVGEVISCSTEINPSAGWGSCTCANLCECSTPCDVPEIGGVGVEAIEMPNILFNNDLRNLLSESQRSEDGSNRVRLRFTNPQVASKMWSKLMVDGDKFKHYSNSFVIDDLLFIADDPASTDNFIVVLGKDDHFDLGGKNCKAMAVVNIEQ